MPAPHWTDGASNSTVSALLFGEQPRSRQASTSAQVAQFKTPRHSQHTSNSTTSATLDVALQRSARNSLDDCRPSLLNDASSVSFAPSMSAPPGGYSSVPLPNVCTDMSADHGHRINVNDPQLISLVNKLQDVFATVGVRPSHAPDKPACPSDGACRSKTP
jgi:hypothetical protein